LNSPDHDRNIRDPFYILKIEKLFQDREGMKVSGPWMWRHSDIVIHHEGREREPNILTRDPQQIYFCENDTVDVNDLSVCKGRCEVLFIRNVKQFEKFSGKRDVFYCMYGYDPQKGQLFKAPTSWIRETINRADRISKFLNNQYQQAPRMKVM
jgi:hypothetical protein